MRITFDERVEETKKKVARRQREEEKNRRKRGLLRWLSRVFSRLLPVARRCPTCNKKETRVWVLQCVSCGEKIP